MLVNNHILAGLVLLLTAGIPGTARAQVWTLQQCMDTAVVHNKRLEIAANGVAISEARHRESKGALLPRLVLQGDYRYYSDLPYQLMPMSVFGGAEGQFREAQFGVPHNINVSGQVSVPLYNPQLSGTVRAMEAASTVSLHQERKTKEQLYFELSNTYYNVQILQHELAFIDRNLANTRKLLATRKLLREQQLATGTDVAKVALQAEQLEARKELLESQHEGALNALKFHMGVSPETVVVVDTTLAPGDPADYADAATTDLMLVQAQGRLLSAEMSALKASRMPTLGLYGAYGTTGFGYAQKPDDFLRFFPLGFAGVQFTHTLFNGGMTRRKIRQKNLEIENNRMQEELLAGQTAMESDNARRRRSVAQRSAANARAQINLAVSVYDQTLLQEKEGIASLTEVLLADNAVREAQQAYVAAIVEFLRADLELKTLTGNILTE